ncbi:MOB kinase activator-like 2 [Aphis craccivora]|uniref:MOB kinase activator-like 2 n=1 Tax=Aphis craccivora TaxID=307492 RepID=A0A6G0ZEN7_APHCR|nr:MOB kinase activator-like 2 [Aphis craccivora]
MMLTLPITLCVELGKKIENIPQLVVWCTPLVSISLCLMLAGCVFSFSGHFYKDQKTLIASSLHTLADLNIQTVRGGNIILQAFLFPHVKPFKPSNALKSTNILENTPISLKRNW